MDSIDKAVEIATEAAHREHYDGPEPPEPVTCVICGKEGTLTDCGWVENPYLDGKGEEDGPWWCGDVLSEADECKDGFICSNRCRSQYMYDHATNDEKEALDAVADACRTIMEYGSRAFRVVEKETCNFTKDYKFFEAVEQFQEAIHDKENDPPEWLNRSTAEWDLWSVINKAALRLEWIGRFPTTVEANCLELSEELKKALKL